MAPEAPKMISTLERPSLKEESSTQSKRTKTSSERPSSKEKKKSSKKADSVKEKREKKVETKQQSNKGLIGAAMTLSMVGMLNYMGPADMPGACTSLTGEKHD